MQSRRIIGVSEEIHRILLERPQAVYIIGMIALTFGILSIIGSIDLYNALKVSEINPNAFAPTLKFYGVGPDYIGYSTTVVMSVLGIVTIATSIGFLRGIKLAWKSLVALSILVIIEAIYSIWETNGAYFPYAVVRLSVYGIILYYLYKPYVKSYFGMSVLHIKK